MAFFYYSWLCQYGSLLNTISTIINQTRNSSSAFDYSCTSPPISPFFLINLVHLSDFGAQFLLLLDPHHRCSVQYPFYPPCLVDLHHLIPWCSTRLDTVHVDILDRGRGDYQQRYAILDVDLVLW